VSYQVIFNMITCIIMYNNLSFLTIFNMIVNIIIIFTMFETAGLFYCFME
jgi:hypothetical protein